MTPAQKAKKTRADKKATAAALSAKTTEEFAKAAELLEAAAAVCDEVGDNVGAGARRDNAQELARWSGTRRPRRWRSPARASNDFDY